MNYAWQQDRLFRMIAALVAAMVVLTLTGAAIPTQAQTYKVLHKNPGAPGISNPSDEAIAQGRDGNLYTTDVLGGVSDDGTLFKFTPSGVATIVNTINYYPAGGVTLGTDGNFYGTNQNGGTFLCGESDGGQVYKVTPAGVQTILHSFMGNGDGCNPYSAPIQAVNGVFYGTTTVNSYGGNNAESTVYTVTSGGVFTAIHTFTGPDGQNVYAPLVQGTDGNFYGDTIGGGTNDLGVIFKMTPAGAVTVLHSFGTPPDGKLAYYGLIQASDGNFYGTTVYGGTGGNGIVFKITPGGTYSVLYNLNGHSDGANPSSSLVQASDGKLYGVANLNGSTQFGTIYSITTSGTYSVVYNFDNATGAYPASPLRQNTNGILYGTTYNGGDLSACNGGGCGVLYSLNIGAVPFAGLVSTSGKEGAKIGILGQGFKTTSVVAFGGVQATSIKLGSATFITATIPIGALTGSVTVTTGTTKLSSNTRFRVTPTFPSFSPTSGPVGTPVVLTGTGLTQTTKVTFGGVKATNVTVNSDNQVTASVPTGAKTGKIVITTKGGSAKSKTDFTVTM